MKLIKILSKTILIFMGLMIVAIMGIIFFVNPNQFKGMLEAQILERTGLHVSIQGPAEWRFFPILALEFNDVSLQNSLPFQNKFASIKTLRAEAEFWAAFSGGLPVNLKIQGLNLNFEKDASGKANWEIFQNQINQKTISQSSHISEAPNNSILQVANKTNMTTSRSQTSGLSPSNSTGQNELEDSNLSTKPKFKVLLNNILIEKSQINFNDDSKNQQYQLREFNANIKNIVDGLKGNVTNPISLNFHFGQINDPCNGEVALSLNWLFDKQSQDLFLKNVNLDFASSNPRSASNNSSIPQAIPNMKIDLHGDFIVTLTQKTLKTPTIKGNFVSKKLQFNQFILENIKGTVSSSNGFYTLEPIQFQFLKSQQQVSLTADLNRAKSKFTLIQYGQPFEATDLLSLFNQKNKIEGKIQIKTNLTASGNNSDEIQNSLTGKVILSVQNGKFYGADLISLLKSTHFKVDSVVSGVSHGKVIHNLLDLAPKISSELQEDKLAVGPIKSTPFKDINTTLQISNGTLATKDLLIAHSEYEIKGVGSLQLKSQQIQSDIDVISKHTHLSDESKMRGFLLQTPLSISIKGTLNNSTVRPNYNLYINNALKYAQKNILKEVIQDKIKDNLKDALEDKLKSLIR